MKNILCWFLVGFVFISCQKNERNNKIEVSKKIKNDSVKTDTIDEISINLKKNEVVVKLPKDKYVVITLKNDNEKEKYYEEDLKDTYKPVSVKTFDSKTKKEIPEQLWRDSIFTTGDDYLMYADFNFDGKMDIAIARNSSHLGFYRYNFYLGKSSGYVLNKEFSEIIDETDIQTIKLDTKNKTISIDGALDWDESWVFKVDENKLKLIKHTIDDDYHSPFSRHYVENYGKVIIDQTKVSYRDDFFVMSFTTKDKKKKILIFASFTDEFNLYCVEMKDKEVMNKVYGDKFTYDKKTNVLSCEGEGKQYRIYENEEAFGLEEIYNREKTIFEGDPSTKKGTLKRLLEPININDKSDTLQNLEVIN